MKKTFLLLVSLISLQAQSQGCSDAGFCTMEIFKPNNLFHKKATNNTLKIGLNIGKADNAITAFGQYIEYSRIFDSSFSLNTKITSLSLENKTLNNFNLSDLYINGIYNINPKTSLALGFKIPFSNGNDSFNRITLPMDFQSSLGTFDVIIGFTRSIKKLKLSLGYQQPLLQNKNTFINFDNNSGFFTTNGFERSGDILIRASYPFNIYKKLKFTPSILPIYHLTEDKIKIENKKANIKDSDGLTLNANAYFDYKLNEKSNLQLSIGMPLKVRKIRPDGLTRKFVTNLEYRLNF